MYEDYICEACGFTSQEKRGVYKCPVCGTQMKVHHSGGRHSGGGLTNSAGKLLIYFIECIIILPICLVFLNVFGIIVFIIILLLTRWYINKNVQNKAIRTIPVKNPGKIYKCSSCGHSFKGQQPNCPNCGIKLNYTD